MAEERRTGRIVAELRAEVLAERTRRIEAERVLREIRNEQMTSGMDRLDPASQAHIWASKLERIFRRVRQHFETYERSDDG